MSVKHAEQEDYKQVISKEPSRTAGALSYSPALDGLRALAVLAVLVSHFGLGPTLAPIEQLLPWGHMGVQLFFVLSGFLITNILLSCREKIHDRNSLKLSLKAFYARRALRIFPAYYLVIFLVFLFGEDEFRQVVLYHIFYLSNTVSAVYSGYGATGSLIHPSSAHFWSLSVEEQFYMFWPLAVFLTPIRRLPFLALCLVLLAPLTRASLFALEYAHVVGYLPTATDALGIGGLLALYRGGLLWANVSRYVPALIGGAALGGLLCLLAHNLDVMYRLRQTLFPLFEAIIYATLVNQLLLGRLPRLNWVLSQRFLVAIGRVSYAIYLTHTFVANSVGHLVPGFTTLPGFTRFGFATAATFIVAFVSWRLFEGPINNLKTRYPYPKSTSSNAS